MTAFVSLICVGHKFVLPFDYKQVFLRDLGLGSVQIIKCECNMNNYAQ